jgi:KOW motif
MPIERTANIGDSVRVVSGPHEGRSGILTQLREVQGAYSDPEWYAVVAFEQADADGATFTDHIACPVRRLRPQ